MASRSFFKKYIQGFTLIELMVALFIMSIATVLLLANYPDSTLRINLLNSTHTLALQLREAQIRGSAVDSASGVAGGYGVFISLATPSQSAMFGDSIEGVTLKNNAGFPIGDGVYNTAVSPTDTIKGTFVLKERFSFGKLCVASTTYSDPNKYFCNTSYVSPIQSLTIAFIRPSQTAHIYINGTTTVDFPKACIQLFSPKTPNAGHVRSVQVFHSGVITTTATACN